MPGRLKCQRCTFDNFGGHTGRETPLPIPNREVKPARADGTWRETSRESRSPPIYLAEPAPSARAPPFRAEMPALRPTKPDSALSRACPTETFRGRLLRRDGEGGGAE